MNDSWIFIKGADMKRKIGIVFFILGIVFIANAVFGRYLVLPGYFQSLENGVSAGSIPENVPVLKIIKYLLWAFSYKLGIFFILLGLLFIRNRSLKDRIVFTLVGLTYISIAYMDWPFYYSLFFGTGGALITVSIIIIFWNVTNGTIPGGKAAVYQELGYFFLVMAAYNLCPLLGVKAFALNPEKMIKYNLQTTAVSFANHILVELVIGFGLLAFYHIVKSRKTG